MKRPVWDGTERRRQKRFGVKNSAVAYRKAGLLAFLGAFSPRYLIINIGLGGLYFIAKDELGPGQRLDLVIDAPLAAVPIKATGRVVWSRKSADFEAWRTGVAFTALADKHRRLLGHVLDNTVIKKVDISTSIYLKEIERL